MSRSLAVTVIALIALAALAPPAAIGRADRARTTATTRSAARSRTPDSASTSRTPSADPFCVKYDKTQQNVTDFGIVDFLLLEPARVLAAAHQVLLPPDRPLDRLDRPGRGSRSSGTGRATTSSIKARGIAGAYMDDFRIGGDARRPAQRARLPGRVPRRTSSHGGGGVYTDTVASKPDCAARVDTPQEVKQVYKPDWRYPRVAPAIRSPAGRERSPATTGAFAPAKRELLVGRRLERHPVQRRDAVALDRLAVLGRRVADVGGEPPARWSASARCMKRSRVTLATIDAAAIAALVASPSTIARCSWPRSADREAVGEADAARAARPARARRAARRGSSCAGRGRRSRARSGRRPPPARRSA